MNFLGWPLTHDPQWFIYCKRQNLETNELNLLILNKTGPKTNALVWKRLLFPKNVSEIIFVKIISEASRKLITKNSIRFPTRNCFPKITSFSRFLHVKKLGFQREKKNNIGFYSWKQYSRLRNCCAWRTYKTYTDLQDFPGIKNPKQIYVKIELYQHLKIYTRGNLAQPTSTFLNQYFCLKSEFWPKI